MRPIVVTDRGTGRRFILDAELYGFFEENDDGDVLCYPYSKGRTTFEGFIFGQPIEANHTVPLSESIEDIAHMIVTGLM